MKQCAIIASVDKCRKCTESVQSAKLVLSDADLLWPYQPLRLLTGSYREIGEHPLGIQDRKSVYEYCMGTSVQSKEPV